MPLSLQTICVHKYLSPHRLFINLGLCSIPNNREARWNFYCKHTWWSFFDSPLINMRIQMPYFVRAFAMARYTRRELGEACVCWWLMMAVFIPNTRAPCVTESMVIESWWMDDEIGVAGRLKQRGQMLAAMSWITKHSYHRHVCAREQAKIIKQKIQRTFA